MNGETKEEYRNFAVRVSDAKVKSRLLSILFHYLQLRNLILLLIRRNREEHLAQPEARPDLFKLLISPPVMRAVLWMQKGGKSAEKVAFLHSHYRQDSMMQEAMTIASQLKDKIIYELVKQLSESWKSFFALRKIGDLRAREPRAKKLRSINEFSLPIDMECVSFKRKNTIRITLERGKSITVYCQHKALLEAVGGWKAIKQMKLSLKHGEIYLLFSYLPEAQKLTGAPKAQASYAAMDIGILRLLAVYIHDQKSPSLMFDGQAFSSFNALYNRKRAQLQARLDPLRRAISDLEKSARKEGYVPASEIAKVCPRYKELSLQRAQLEKRLKRLGRRRHAFFDTNFKKLAKRLLEHLSAQGVGHLITSRNILEKKSEGSNLGLIQNQRFYHIPFAKLFDCLKLWAPDYGITFIDEIDEAYTSKTSSRHGDVVVVQKAFQPGSGEPDSLRSDVFKGRRVKRGLFQESAGDQIQVHADINAAVNILKLHLAGTFCLSGDFHLQSYKLANPRLIRKNALFCFLDRPSGRRSEREKLAPLTEPTLLS